MKQINKTLIIFTLLLSACKLTPEEKRDMLPLSSGNLTEIVVVTDSRNLDSTLKEQVIATFSKPLEGHPPPGEPMFKVLFTDESFFKGYFQNHHNIFVLLTPDGAEGLKDILNPATIDKMVKVIADNPTNFGVKQKDIYAKNQNIFWLTAPSRKTMLHKLEQEKNDIVQVALDQENASGKRKLLGEERASQDKFYQKSILDRGFGIRKPKTYRVAIDKPDFVWLRKSPPDKELELGLLLFESKYTSKEDITTENLIKVRNAYVKKNIPGEIEDSYMKYSSAMPPVTKIQNFKGKYGVQIRGWWDVEGDFMGGPSYIRAVVDEANSRIVFAEGFLFYPNEDKALEMRELEILVNTLSIK